MLKIDVRKKLEGAEGEMLLHVDLEIAQGEFLALSGVSGSGKTTLLRILAGLEEAEGEIRMSDTVWLDARGKLPPQQRRIGYVFQDYALFENMTVEENLLYVSPDRNLAKKLLTMTELTALKDRLPASLSGGQKQRVSLCRAMMGRPQLLLMDEPLSAIDATMRSKLQQEILALHKTFGTTTIMVSHDPSEIYRLASRVVVLENGRITGDGTPKEVLLHTHGSQKFSFEGELMEITKMDVIFVAVIAIGQQLVEIVISENEAKSLKVGDRVSVSTKAFTPLVTKR
jgi:molybdate transport system ATP-binding protein